MYLQSCGAGSGWRRWPVCVTNIQTAANLKAGSLHARFTLPTGHHAEDNGQRSDVLRPARTFHLHLQVCAERERISASAICVKVEFLLQSFLRPVCVPPENE